MRHHLLSFPLLFYIAIIDVHICIMGKLEDYMEYYDKYQKLYGDKTVVFYQIGKFHEMYGVNNEIEKLGNVEEVAQLLNIKLTRCKTAVLENSRENPLMAGFNSVSVDANVDRLVDCGYTVVVVDQIQSQSGTGDIRREVSYIRSPSTSISVTSSRDPYLVAIYLTSCYNRQYSREYDYIGMTAIDITTGCTYWYETNSNPDDPNLGIDDLTRFLQSFNPVEIIITHDTAKEKIITADQIGSWGYKISRGNRESSFAEIFNNIKPTVHLDYPGFSTLKSNVSFQEQFIAEYYDIQSNILETIGMHRAPMATTSLVHLLKFCSDHNKSLLSYLALPQQWSNEKCMNLETSSIYQLNIIESYYDQVKQNSIYSLLANTLRTAMGRRILRSRLLNCSIEPEVLIERYNYIKFAIETGEETITKVRTLLAGMRDLDRLHRKISLGTLTPAELYMCHFSYMAVTEMGLSISKADQFGLFKSLLADAMSFLHTYMPLYQDAVELELAGCCLSIDNIQGKIFKKGFDKEIDLISEQLDTCDRIRDVACDKISDLIAKGSKCCVYKVGEEACYLSLTKAQFTKLKAGWKDITFIVDGISRSIIWDDLHIDTRNKSNVKINVSLLDELQQQRDELLKKLKAMSSTAFSGLLQKMARSTSRLMSLSAVVGQLDLYFGMARHAIKHNYCIPEIDMSAPSSWVHAVELRHPIVEINVEYKPQTIILDNTGSGMLLYGVNQSGKSCTMKSLGVAIVMAQAGLYVPATSFKYYPFRTLMTRILGNDNLDRGMSAYAVEMTELRSILKRSDDRTIVLGDEICHGTESASAVSLVAASILHLTKCGTKFIFATHLHELAQIKEIAELPTLNLYHLTIDCQGDRIIYDRNLRPGSGRCLYGLEVAKHLRLPDSVLAQAYSIRDLYYSGSTMTPQTGAQFKSSNYNSDKIIGRCAIKECNAQAEHTHHIRYQCEADSRGYVTPSMHKNHQDNLVGLCHHHHNHIHHGDESKGEQLVIFGYNGKELVYKYRKLLHTLL